MGEIEFSILDFSDFVRGFALAFSRRGCVGHDLLELHQVRGVFQYHARAEDDAGAFDEGGVEIGLQLGALAADHGLEVPEIAQLDGLPFLEALLEDVEQAVHHDVHVAPGGGAAVGDLVAQLLEIAGAGGLVHGVIQFGVDGGSLGHVFS